MIIDIISPKIPVCVPINPNYSLQLKWRYILVRKTYYNWADCLSRERQTIKIKKVCFRTRIIRNTLVSAEVFGLWVCKLKQEISWLPASPPKLQFQSEWYNFAYSVGCMLVYSRLKTHKKSRISHYCQSVSINYISKYR